MNDDQLDDLKQFILATVSQATANMATKDDLVSLVTKEDLQSVKAELKGAIADLEAKVDTIADALTEDHQALERRVTLLEQRAA